MKKFLSEDRLPHLLFYGPPGTGKTSTILAIKTKLYEPKEIPSLVLELNASDDRGIDIVRTEIVNFVSARNIFSDKIKLVILDEADAMTKDAQNALRRGVYLYCTAFVSVSVSDFCLRSYGKIYESRSLLYRGQLPVENYSCHSVSLYPIPICTFDNAANATSIGSRSSGGKASTIISGSVSASFSLKH